MIREHDERPCLTILVPGCAGADPHAGQSPGRSRHPHPDDPGEGDAPLVHTSLAADNLPSLRGVGLVLPVYITSRAFDFAENFFSPNVSFALALG